MKIIEWVEWDVVLACCRRAHPPDRMHPANTNGEVEALLRAAAERPGGRWHRVLLNRQDVLEVVLPWHLGEDGAQELVPAQGLTVGQAAALVASKRQEYSQANPVCWGKLVWHATATFSPLFLSSGAIGEVDYRRLRTRDAVTHLDGLHRMIAWELWNRLPDDERMEAYLAIGDSAASERAGGPGLRQSAADGGD